MALVLAFASFWNGEFLHTIGVVVAHVNGATALDLFFVLLSSWVIDVTADDLDVLDDFAVGSGAWWADWQWTLGEVDALVVKIFDELSLVLDSILGRSV